MHKKLLMETLLSGIAALALSGCGTSMTAANPTPAPNPPPAITPPSSRFLYVVDSIQRTVSGYSINAASGMLSQAGVPVATADAPIYAAATPDGNFLYVADAGTDSSDVSAYRIDQSTGALTPTSPATFPTTGESEPFGIAVDPASAHVYTANVNGISAFAIDPSSGNLSNVQGTPVSAPPGAGFADLTVSPDGKHLYVTDNAMNRVWTYTFNALGLPVQSGGAVSAGMYPVGIVVDPAGKFAYVANWLSNDVSRYSITPATGALIPAAATTSVGAGCEPQELAVNPASSRLFVSCPGLSTIVAFSIDPASGALTPMPPTFSPGPATGPRGVAVDRSGMFLYSAWNTQNRAGTAAINNDGSLAPVAGPPKTGNGPIGVVVSGSQ